MVKLSIRTPFWFFQQNGVELCSGFGMTEATGGITMTLPGQYVYNSVGIPLPGVKTRLTQNSELQISGHYIARYLHEKKLDETIPYPESPQKDYWLATGDLFRVSSNGHYEIVDRIKDIYKNNRGQTIAPRKVEKKFTAVPGIKRVFLAGDKRAYNVLLIVPDNEAPILRTSTTPDIQSEYFHQIVAVANQDLAPYERVVNYTILDRDFELQREEITAKGSFNRKTIEKHFAQQIEELYRSNFIELPGKGFRVRIPRWFFRDLGVIEDDILIHSRGLYNRRTGNRLALRKISNSSRYRIGNLEYTVSGNVIDMGLLPDNPGCGSETHP